MTRLVVALSIAVALLAAPAPARAGDEPAQLRITQITPWVPSGGSFDVHLAGLPADLDLVVAVHARISSRSQFTRTLDGELLGRVQRQYSFATGALPVAADGDRVLSLPLPRLDTPAGPATLPGLRDGVFPVTLSLRDAGETVDRAVTHLVRLPDGPVTIPLAVAMVVPLAGAGPTALTDVADALDAAAGAGVDVTIDPEPRALAALAPEEVASLRRAVAGGDQLLAAPWVDVDPSALAAAGRGSDLAAQRQSGEDALLRALGERGDPRTWSVDAELTAGAATRLRQLGITRVVVPEKALEPLPASATRGLTLTRPFRLAGSGDEEPFDATAAEPGLSAHLRNGPDEVLRAQDLLADLAVLFYESPGSSRGVTVRPPASWRPSATFLRAALPPLAQAPILRSVTLDGLFRDVPPLGGSSPVTRRLDPSPLIATLPKGRLDAAATAANQLAALLGPSAPLVATSRERLLLAESSRLSGAARRAVLASITGALDEVRGKVRVTTDRTFRLTAREGTIPLTVVNDNPFPVRVDLELSSEKLEFTEVGVGDASRLVVAGLTIDPGTFTRTVPVRARASATFSLRARLLAPDGAELARARYTVISTVFSGVGIALSVAAGLFLLLWWASHWRTVRRSRRLADPPS